MAGRGLISVWQKLRRSKPKEHNNFRNTLQCIFFLIIYNDEFFMYIVQKKILSDSYFVCTLWSFKSCLHDEVYLSSFSLTSFSQWFFISNMIKKYKHFTHKKKIMVFFVNACKVLIFHLVYFWKITALLKQFDDALFPVLEKRPIYTQKKK